MEHLQSCNFAAVNGIVNTIPKYSHEIHDEKFYTFELAVKRKSGVFDNLQIIFSDRVCDANSVNIGQNIAVEGQFRSYNNPKKEGNRLLLFVFVKSIKHIKDNVPDFFNHFTFQGYLCKPVVYRQTPLGREISDMLIAANRSFNKTDYLPCIAWGRNAKFASALKVGSRIFIEGRIQSREYIKARPEGEIKRIAYEVSVTKLKLSDIT